MTHNTGKQLKAGVLSRIVEVADKENEFVTLEDGFVYYWPKLLDGCLAAHELRELADELDKRNKEWNDNINEYFGVKE